MNKGFTAIETLLTLGIVAITAGMSIPLYQNYQIRSDLDLAVAQTLHNLSSAQLKSQTGEEDGQWGAYIPDGTVFMGENFITRDEDFDSTIVLPVGISVFGIEEVMYSRVYGVPSPTGEIILEASSGERRIITINEDGTLSASQIEELDSGSDSGDTGSDDSGGDSGSDDGGDSGSDDSGGDSGSDDGGDSGSSDGGDTGGDSGGGSSGGGGGDDDDDGEPTCEDRFSVADDGTITTTGTVSATVKALGAEITYGSDGPEIQVKADISTDGGTTWNDLFNNAEIDGGEQQTIDGLASNQQLVIKVNGRYGWLFNKTYKSNDESGHIEVLRNGDDPPEYDAYGNQAGLETFLQDIIDENGKISINEYDVVILTELGSLGTSSADFQDAVFLIQFGQPVGSCADNADPRFKFAFDRLENIGSGDAEKRAYVGQAEWAYSENQWIPLLSPDSQIATDGGMPEDVPGFAVERHNGFVRVLLHGSHTNGGKEIVDARIIFDGAEVVSLQNVEGINKSENPFDGIVNDGAGGDEATIISGNGSALFQTRVTVQDDTIDIYWTEAAGGGSSDDDDDDSGSSGGSDGGTGSSDDDDDGDGDNDDGQSNNQDDDDDGDGDNDDGIADNTVPTDPCAAAYVMNNGRITVTEKSDVSFEVLGSHATYGNNGPEIQMHLSVSTDGGSTWESLFGFKDVDGGEQYTIEDVAANSTILLKAEGRRGWLFKKVTTSGDGSGRIKMLRNKNADPDTTIFRTPIKLKSFMKKVIKSRKVSIKSKQILSLIEIQDIDGSEDYQDAAILITLEKPASQGICGAASDDDDDDGSSDDDDGSSSGGSSGGSDGGSGGDDGGSEEGDEDVVLCHFPPGNPQNHQTMTVPGSAWAGHANHGDRRGECEGDEDGDGILNSRDLCPGTYMPESVPTEHMLFKRYALTRDSFVFHKGPRKKIGNYTLADTAGCSCEQLVDVAEGKKSYRFNQFPRVKRLMRSLFPFYTNGARKYGCGKAMIKMIKKNAPM
jgi:type II secretory pathway pseudopilin PulG